MRPTEEQDVALKILHTADWHLGRGFPSFMEVDQPKLTQARIEAVDKLLGLAESYAVNAVLCAGDLFHEPTPADTWWRELLRLFERRKWKERPVFLLPGNHDPLWPTSVWADDHPFRRGLPDWVHVVDREDYEFALSEEAVLYAVPCRSQAGADDPTAHIPVRRPGDQRIRIGLVHGQTFDIAGHEMNFPIAADAAQKRGLNYLALGDTHGFRELPPKEAPAVYPGAPEATTFGESEAGFVAVVLFPRQGRSPIIQKQRVSRWRWRDERCTSMQQLEALRREDLKECVFRLTLQMEVTISERARVDDILEELKGNEAVCGKVGVLHEDTTGLEVNVYDASDFDDTLPDVLRSVVARLQAQANEPDGKVARQAIVLLHKTLRSLPDQAGGASAPRGGAEQ
jgi:DNA repair exonuclease SbcCD nuclease subunit